MTAAHCVPTTFSYNYNGNIMNLPIKTNDFYPTMASMYTIYAGKLIIFASKKQLRFKFVLKKELMVYLVS
jgi:hypothetical protein